MDVGGYDFVEVLPEAALSVEVLFLGELEDSPDESDFDESDFDDSDFASFPPSSLLPSPLAGAPDFLA